MLSVRIFNSERFIAIFFTFFINNTEKTTNVWTYETNDDASVCVHIESSRDSILTRVIFSNIRLTSSPHPDPVQRIEIFYVNLTCSTTPSFFDDDIRRCTFIFSLMFLSNIFEKLYYNSWWWLWVQLFVFCCHLHDMKNWMWNRIN